MANPLPQNIESLLERISNLSTTASLRSITRESGSLHEPKHGLSTTPSAPEALPDSINALVAKMQGLSLSTRASLARTIRNRQLGMLSHTPAETRVLIYDLVAENSTYALNENEAMRLLTSGQSNPPSLMKASPQYESEFEERLRKTAWPTILIRQKLTVISAATTIVLDLIDEHCLRHGRLSKLAIVVQSFGGPFVEIAETTGLLVNLLSPLTIIVPNHNHSNLTKLRVIIYIKHWETIIALQQPNNTIDWAVKNLWMGNHAIFVPHTPRATRFPALLEMEIEMRYESPWGAEEYTYYYSKEHGQAPDCDTIFIPTSTEYRVDLERAWSMVQSSPSYAITVLLFYLKTMGYKWLVICVWKVVSRNWSIALGSGFRGLLWIGTAEMMVLLKWGWLSIFQRGINIFLRNDFETWKWWAWVVVVWIWMGYMQLSVPMQIW